MEDELEEALTEREPLRLFEPDSNGPSHFKPPSKSNNQLQFLQGLDPTLYLN